MRRKGFSLVELLVAITIILVLMALMGAAVSAARSAGAKQRTQATITTIDEIIRRHFVNSESRRTGESGNDRALALRRQVTADMPDSWAEVAYMKQRNDATPPNQPKPFAGARQRGYIATYQTLKPSSVNSSAECLFMIVTQGGLADCLTCGALELARKGDTDNDGALEFLDAWGEPIQYVLWPAAFELPLGTDYFSTTPTFDGSTLAAAPDGTDPAKGGTLRPLIFSAGPDKLGSTRVHGGSYLAMGANCGNPMGDPNIPQKDDQVEWLGGHDDPENPSAPDHRSDNITNFDGEAKR